MALRPSIVEYRRQPCKITEPGSEDGACRVADRALVDGMGGAPCTQGRAGAASRPIGKAGPPCAAECPRRTGTRVEPPVSPPAIPDDREQATRRDGLRHPGCRPRCVRPKPTIPLRPPNSYGFTPPLTAVSGGDTVPHYDTGCRHSRQQSSPTEVHLTEAASDSGTCHSTMW